MSDTLMTVVGMAILVAVVLPHMLFSYLLFPKRGLAWHAGLGLALTFIDYGTLALLLAALSIPMHRTILFGHLLLLFAVSLFLIVRNGTLRAAARNRLLNDLLPPSIPMKVANGVAVLCLVLFVAALPFVIAPRPSSYTEFFLLDPTTEAVIRVIADQPASVSFAVRNHERQEQMYQVTAKDQEGVIVAASSRFSIPRGETMKSSISIRNVQGGSHQYQLQLIRQGAPPEPYRTLSVWLVGG